LINSWFSYTLSLFILTLLCFSFFGYSHKFNTFLLPAFVSEVWGITFFVLAQISNTVTLGILKLSFLLFSVKMYFSRIFNITPDFIFDTFEKSKINGSSKSTTIAMPYELSTNSYFTPETLLLTHNLSKVNYALNKLQDSKRMSNFFQSTQFKTETPIEFLLYESIDFNFSEDCEWKPTQLCYSIKAYKPSFAFDNKSLKLSLSTLNKLQNSSMVSYLSNFNIYKNLNQSKQNRWLLKNSLLSNSSTSNLFSFTQAKNLMGNTLYSSLNTSQNIWNSSKLTQLSKTNELLNLSFFQNNNLKNSFKNTNLNLTLFGKSPSDIQNFNFFETSQLWNTKKFFFTNQLKSNSLQLTNSLNDSNLLNKQDYASKPKLTTLINLLNYSLQNQTQGLLVSTPFKTQLHHQNSLISSLDSTIYTNDLDHLKTFNANFLLDLTTINSTFSMPIYVFTSLDRQSMLSTPLTFKSTN
jgi:hypothetical protein